MALEDEFLKDMLDLHKHIKEDEFSEQNLVGIFLPNSGPCRSAVRSAMPNADLDSQACDNQA